MPAYPTHTLFSHLALLALIEERHPLAQAVSRHEALFRVAGIAGCDIQCMPYQICRRCDAPYRHDQKENRVCLVCKREALQDFYFDVSDGRRLTRRDVERDLYANTHLVLHRKYRGYGIPPGTAPGTAEQPFPEQVIRHLANTLRDAEKIAGRKRVENYLAFTLGWFSHVVSDAIFKGVYPHAAKVNFFGDQYSMKMLPAAETLTMTDLSYDFGVNWPVWHRQLLHAESDGGALKHLAMGNPAERYDTRYWTSEFGKPDPAIGRVLEAVQPLNRKWFHRMYVQPDYSAPSPRLDDAPLSTRATWRFGESAMDLGQLRQYALPAGWYAAFITGVGIYIKAVNEASRLAGLNERRREQVETSPSRPGITSWNLWRQIVQEATDHAVYRDTYWGSLVEIDPDATGWLRRQRNKPVRIITGERPTDYQDALVKILETKFVRRRKVASTVILIGPPAFNPAARQLLCVEDALRLKYDRGLAALVRLNPENNALLLAGFSDFGDHRLGDWLTKLEGV